MKLTDLAITSFPFSCVKFIIETEKLGYATQTYNYVIIYVKRTGMSRYV